MEGCWQLGPGEFGGSPGRRRPGFREAGVPKAQGCRFGRDQVGAISVPGRAGDHPVPLLWSFQAPAVCSGLFGPVAQPDRATVS